MGAWAKERESCGTFLWKRPQGPHNLQRPFVSPPPPSASLLAASSVTRLQSNSRRPLVARSLQKRERARFGWTRRNLVRFGSSESHIFFVSTKDARAMIEKFLPTGINGWSGWGWRGAEAASLDRLQPQDFLSSISWSSNPYQEKTDTVTALVFLATWSTKTLSQRLTHIYCFVDLTIITLRPYLWLSLLTSHHCHHWHLLVQLWLISLID